MIQVFYKLISQSPVKIPPTSSYHNPRSKSPLQAHITTPQSKSPYGLQAHITIPGQNPPYKLISQSPVKIPLQAHITIPRQNPPTDLYHNPHG